MQYQDDQVYINRIVKGEAAAFGLLVDKHKSKAFNIALRIVKNREDAEEVTQDAFVKAWHALKEFRGEARFSTWLYRIIYNQAMTLLRKKKLPVQSYNDEATEWLEPAALCTEMERLHDREQKKYINEALSVLPGEDANMVSLYYLHDCSIEEISEITGLGQSNVKVKLFRARKRLFTALNRLLKTEIKQLI